MNETRQPPLKESGPHASTPKRNAAGSGRGMLDDPDALTVLVQQSFQKATRHAIEENDRLGIPRYGGKDGKIVVRQPCQAKASTDPA